MDSRVDDLGDSRDNIEPDQNMSQVFAFNDKKMEEQITAITQEWLQENLMKLPTDSNAKLVDFFFLNSKMLCIFEDF